MVLKKTTPTAKKTSKKVTQKVATSKVLRKKKPGDAQDTAKPVKKAMRAGKTSGSAIKRKSGPTTSIDFAPGTDMATAFQEVLKGGASRADVSHRLADMWAENLTRNGNNKPVSTILNHVIRRAKANGYEIQQTWKLVKVGERPAEVVRETAAADGVTYAKDTTPKKTARKLPARKAVKRPAKA